MVLYAEIKFEVKNLFPITLSPTDEEINMYDWKAYVKSFLTRFTQRQVCWNQNKKFVAKVWKPISSLR